MVSKQDSAKWNEIVAQSIDEQANVFLRAFVLDFAGGGFEEVLDIASQFKRYAPKEGVPDLEEHKAHLFLEKRGETLTVQQLRLTLKDIDVDNNNRVAFLEYALFKWKKTPQQFFTELAKPPQRGGAALEAAIAEYRKVIAIREARENRIEELKAEADAGGVKGAKAKNELAQLLHEDQLHQNKAEITSAAKKRAAEKTAIDPFAEEQKRLEEEKKKKDAEEKAKQDESRAKLKAKTSLWENK